MGCLISVLNILKMIYIYRGMEHRRACTIVFLVPDYGTMMIRDERREELQACMSLLSRSFHLISRRATSSERLIDRIASRCAIYGAPARTYDDMRVENVYYKVVTTGRAC